MTKIKEVLNTRVPDLLTLVETDNEGLQASLHFISVYVDRIKKKKYVGRIVTKMSNDFNSDEIRLNEEELRQDEIETLRRHVANVGGCIDHFIKTC